MLSQIISRKLNFALSSPELSLISTWHNNTNFNNSLFNSIPLFILWNLQIVSVLKLVLIVPKQQVILLPRIYCSSGRWWPIDAPYFATSSQDFHIQFVKNLIELEKLVINKRFWDNFLLPTFQSKRRIPVNTKSFYAYPPNIFMTPFHTKK